MAQVTLASTSKSVVVPHKQASSWYLQYDEYYNPLIGGRISVQEYLEVVRSLNKTWDDYAKKRRILFLSSIVVHMINGLIFGSLVYSNFFFYYLPVFFVILIGAITLSTYLTVKWQKQRIHEINKILSEANAKLSDRKIEWKLFPKWLAIEFDDNGVTVIQIDNAMPVYYQQPGQYPPTQYPPQYPPQYPQYGTYNQANPNAYPGQVSQQPPQYQQPPSYQQATEQSSLLSSNHS